MSNSINCFPWVICFEGLPGGGKTTQLKKIKKWLLDMGLRVSIIDLDTVEAYPLLQKTIKELSIDDPVRSMYFWPLQAQKDREISKIIEADLYDVILLNRHFGSTIAYDCAIGIPPTVLDYIGTHIKVKPHLTFYLQVPISIAIKRKNAASFKRIALLEKISMEFQRCKSMENWVVVDATKSIIEVFEMIIMVIQVRFRSYLKKENLAPRRPRLKLVDPQTTPLDLKKTRVS